MATHSSILAWEIPCPEEPWRATVHGVAKELNTTVTRRRQQMIIPSERDKRKTNYLSFSPLILSVPGSHSGYCITFSCRVSFRSWL